MLRIIRRVMIKERSKIRDCERKFNNDMMSCERFKMNNLKIVIIVVVVVVVVRTEEAVNRS